MALGEALLRELRALFGGDSVAIDAACLAYGYDSSRRRAAADAVVFPTARTGRARWCAPAAAPLATPAAAAPYSTGATVPVSLRVGELSTRQTLRSFHVVNRALFLPSIPSRATCPFHSMAIPFHFPSSPFPSFLPSGPAVS